MKASHHSHSGQFCKHAVGTLKDVVEAAVAAGFEVFGLTEHVPRYRRENLYPEEVSISSSIGLSDLHIQATISPADLAETFDLFVIEAHRLKTAYADKITLLVGLETDYITTNDLDQLEKLLARHTGQIEYVVGSVHHCNGIPIDFDKPSFERAVASFAETSPAAIINNQTPTPCQISFLNSYFYAQLQLMERIHPEVIGHFDLCRLYTPLLSLQEVWPQVERNVRYAIEYGAVFELNAAAFRKGWDSAYPGRDIVQVRQLDFPKQAICQPSPPLPSQLIQSLGGTFVLSDDSHGPAAVGLNYDRLERYVSELNISKVAHLERRQTENAGARYLHPAIH